MGENARPAWSSDPKPASAGPRAPSERSEPSGAPPPAAKAGKPPAPVKPAHVRLERQGRGGKVVTVVDGLPGHPERIEEIARTLKSQCGAGGTVKGRVVEVQGDHRDRVVAVLASLGITAKRAGG